MLASCDWCEGRGEIRTTDAAGSGDWVTCGKCKGTKLMAPARPHWPPAWIVELEKESQLQKPVVLRAETILERALAAVRQRGKDYDKPQGERSFHELAKRTGMTPSKACEFLIELKKVRLDTTNWTHEDSLVDLLAYYALWSELKQEEPVAGVRSNHPYEG